MEWGHEREDIEERLRQICVALPEAHEGPAFNGRSSVIRKNHVCQVFTLGDGDEQSAIIIFRSKPPELDALSHAGHPFFKPRWGARVMGMVIDDCPDWNEVGELITDSYRIQTPKKLAARVNGPD
jgi:hypothetical protein